VKTKWAWFIGIATLGALVIGTLVIFSIPGFQVLSFSLGAAAGATAAGMIAALLISDEASIARKPKKSPAPQTTASIASHRKSHGARLESYPLLPSGRRFVWTKSNGIAGTIRPDGEGFMLYAANDQELYKVADVEEAVKEILLNADR
jgi:hypothetical protein